MHRNDAFAPSPSRLNELRSEALRQTLRGDWGCHLFVLLWALSALVMLALGKASLLWLVGPALAGWVGLGVLLSRPRLEAALRAERERAAALSEVGKAIEPGWS